MLTPTTMSNWVRTKWSMDMLDAFMAPRILTSRMNDRSDEVTGEPMQTLTIIEMEQIDDEAVGDLGEVGDLTPPSNTQNLVINQYRARGLLFRDDHDLQVVAKKGKWAKWQAEALLRTFETYALSLETGVNSAAITDVAGDITDVQLSAAAALRVTLNWPDENVHMAVSGGQMAAIRSDDRFSDAQFIGDRNHPVVSGKMTAIYGMEMLTSSLIRRYSISGTVRTVNMIWIGNHEGGGAFVKGVQQDVKVKIVEQDLARKVIPSMLYGVTMVGTGATVARRKALLYRTTNA